MSAVLHKTRGHSKTKLICLLFLKIIIEGVTWGLPTVYCRLINNFQQIICFYEHSMFIRTAFFISSGRFNLISLYSEKILILVDL